MKKKILVVDDEPCVLLSIQNGFEDYNDEYDVTGVSSGKECFDLLAKEYLPDIILLDIMMPEMNGWTVQHQLRQHTIWKDIPLVFLTAVEDKTSKRYAGFVSQDFIEKPFEIADVIQRVEHILQNSNTKSFVKKDSSIQKKLLVVDDDPTILLAIKELFEPEGYTVFTAKCAQECLDELSKGFKGVILMDIMMPVMDGWDTIREMVKKGYDKGNIISMFTAKDEIDVKVDDLKEFVIDYITKPFDPDDLVKTINEYYSYVV